MLKSKQFMSQPDCVSLVFPTALMSSKKFKKTTMKNQYLGITFLEMLKGYNIKYLKGITLNTKRHSFFRFTSV